MPSQRRRWESSIEDSLKELSAFLADSNWFGRENEIINLFAHRFLLAQLNKGPLTDLSQIGIEVAVKQLPRARGKKLVRKDLVLWNHPLETVWADGTAFNSPAAILEWKTGKITYCETDISWLQAYTQIYPQVLGYSICAFIGDKRGIWYRKIKKGHVGRPVVYSNILMP
jgi:hypothetical protein